MKLFMGPGNSLMIPLNPLTEYNVLYDAIVQGEVKIGYWFEVISTEETDQRLVKFKATAEEQMAALRNGKQNCVYRS